MHCLVLEEERGVSKPLDGNVIARNIFLLMLLGITVEIIVMVILPRV